MGKSILVSGIGCKDKEIDRLFKFAVRKFAYLKIPRIKILQVTPTVSHIFLVLPNFLYSLSMPRAKK